MRRRPSGTPSCRRREDARRRRSPPRPAASLTRSLCAAFPEGLSISCDGRKLALRWQRARATLGDCAIDDSSDLVTITWPGIETDPARLQAAIALLQKLARPASHGVFR